MRITHINDSALRIAALSDPTLMDFTVLHWISTSEKMQYRAKYMLRRLIDPSVTVRKMRTGRSHLGYCAVVSMPIWYPKLGMTVSTVIAHTEVLDHRPAAREAASELLDLIA
jgi:hypothetical protein